MKNPKFSRSFFDAYNLFSCFIARNKNVKLYTLFSVIGFIGIIVVIYAPDN